MHANNNDQLRAKLEKKGHSALARTVEALSSKREPEQYPLHRDLLDTDSDDIKSSMYNTRNEMPYTFYNRYINQTAQNGVTPLHLAVLKKENYNVVSTLLDSEANVKAKTEDGHTALSIAVDMGSSEIVEKLLSYAKKYSKDKDDDELKRETLSTIMKVFFRGKFRAEKELYSRLMGLTLNLALDIRQNYSEKDEISEFIKYLIQHKKLIDHQSKVEALDKALETAVNSLLFVSEPDNFRSDLIHVIASLATDKTLCDQFLNEKYIDTIRLSKQYNTQAKCKNFAMNYAERILPLLVAVDLLLMFTVVPQQYMIVAGATSGAVLLASAIVATSSIMLLNYSNQKVMNQIKNISETTTSPDQSDNLFPSSEMKDSHIQPEEDKQLLQQVG